MKFFLNRNTTAYLRSLETEFGESSNAIRVELNRLEGAGLLTSRTSGNKKIFQANHLHPLFEEIHNILLKQIGLDRIIEHIVERLGDIEKVYLAGAFSKGLDSPIIDLILIGEIDQSYLIQLIDKVEKAIHRKIRYLIYSPEEFEELEQSHFRPPPLLLWLKEDS
jgi:hypothetical protein